MTLKPPLLNVSLAKSDGEPKRNKYLRFLVSALGGSIPWVGPFLSAAASLHSEVGQGEHSALAEAVRQAQEAKLNQLLTDVAAIAARLEALEDSGTAARLDEESYLSIANRAFRTWDRAESQEKRALVVRVLTNAAATSLTSDDVVRLFVDWIDRYDEMHFAVIREVHKSRGATRLSIWEALRGDLPKENSADADLYRLLIDELSQGRIIRQLRDTDFDGRFLKKPRGRKQSSQYLQSSFDDEKGYELTALGTQFIHYAMNDAVARVGG